jgi:hypothetical protein
MSTAAVVLVDDDDPCLSSYLSLKMLPGWTVEVGPHSGLSEIYNQAFKRHSDEEWYGVICDDVIPKTDYFDIRLIEVAGKDGLAVPSGGHDPQGAPHFVLGGDLVRSVGWLSLPGLSRLYIDATWLDIANQRGVLRRVSGVVLEHHHFSNGKALMDKTYRKPNREADREIYETWKHNWRTVW